MARTKHLPIYKVGYDLLQMVTQLIKHFSRDYRPTLGNRLHAECVNLVVLVYRANAARDKAPHLDALLESLQVVEMLLQLASDLHLISRGQYARTMPLTDGIGKQAGGCGLLSFCGFRYNNNKINHRKQSHADQPTTTCRLLA